MLTKGSIHQPRLVFLHGLFGKQEDFVPLFEHLQNEYLCIAFDLPKSCVINQVQKRVESLAPDVLVGYSMGGRIALQMLTPAKKILISSHIGKEDKEKRRQWQEEWTYHFHTLTPLTFFQKWYTQPLFSSLQSRPELLQELISERAKQLPVKSFTQFVELDLLSQPSMSLLGIRLIYGKKDSKYSELYRNFSSDAIGIEDVGHICHIEDPEGCANAIRRHLNDLL